MRDDVVVDVSGAKRLLSKCVSVDLEVDPKTNWIQTFAAVRPGLDEAFVYRRGNLADAFRGLDEFAEGAEFLVGHNIIHFDARHLEAANANLKLLKKQTIDTLWLNPLAFRRSHSFIRQER